jgi:hypothetical protein
VKTFWNQLNAPLFNKGFPNASKVQQEALWFRRSQCDKQTKQTNYLSSYMYDNLLLLLVPCSFWWYFFPFCFFIGWESFSSECMLRFDFHFFNISLFSLFVLFVICFFFSYVFVCLSKCVCVLCFWCLCLFVCNRSCVYFKFFGLRM